MSKKDAPEQIKLIFLGETGVGKTSIFTRYIKGKFDENRIASIGVDFETKPLKYKGKSYIIQLFDTAGQERFRSIINGYYNMAKGIFIVFDLTNENSLNSIDYWVNNVKENNQEGKIVILGNKSDLKNEILKEEIINRQLEKYKDTVFIKTSAKTNKNINEAFERIIDVIENNEVKRERINSFVMEPKKHKSIKKKDSDKCC